jgi:AcrR family transcriptional regulator
LTDYVQAAERSTRDRILDAAEQLMAERGVDAVSLREINSAADQRNASGVQYYFHNRLGLVMAVIERHMSAVDERRNQLLDELDLHDATAAAVLRTLVAPLADELGSPSGRRYLRILQDLFSRPQSDAARGSILSMNRGLRRVRPVLTRLLTDLPPPVRQARTSLCMIVLLATLADEARTIDEQPEVDRLRGPLFVSNLVDVLAGVLSAPASEDTVHLAAGVPVDPGSAP